MTLKKTPITEQPPLERIKNFAEVTLGYSAEEAKAEAARCLNCKNPPCMKGCPVGVKIPKFITKIAEGDFSGAYSVVSETNALPAVCGRVCPQESQCEKLCVRKHKGEPVAIGRLERFAAEFSDSAEKMAAVAQNGKKIAVIGAGPAGLTCAGDLAKLGYDVTVFEAFHVAGGVLVYGIPEFRLPMDVVQREIYGLEKAGVKIVTNFIAGRTMTVDELFAEGFEAVFVGTGAGLPKFLGIAGENLNGVYSANEFLTRINLMGAHRSDTDTPIVKSKNVAVIGGGNVAMDAARCALRTGAEHVSIVYRRGRDEMPARVEEIHHAEEEGIDFQLLVNPLEVIGDENGCVKALRCVKMVLGEPDASGRRRPVEVANSEFKLETDGVIMALGTSPNPLVAATTVDLTADKNGCLEVDENMMTKRAGVFAGGDAVTGAATVILAMGAGKAAAAAMHRYISGEIENI